MAGLIKFKIVKGLKPLLSLAAASFNGTSFKEIPHDPKFAVREGVFSIWFKLGQKSTAVDVIGLFGKDKLEKQPPGHILLEARARRWEARLQTGTTDHVLIGPLDAALDTNKHHAALAFGPRFGWRFYLDGVLVGAVLTVTQGLELNTLPIILGASPRRLVTHAPPYTGLEGFLKGTILSFNLYGVELTADDIRNRMKVEESRMKYVDPTVFTDGVKPPFTDGTHWVP